jgi:hypothetical protein
LSRIPAWSENAMPPAVRAVLPSSEELSHAVRETSADRAAVGEQPGEGG